MVRGVKHIPAYSLHVPISVPQALNIDPVKHCLYSMLPKCEQCQQGWKACCEKMLNNHKTSAAADTLAPLLFVPLRWSVPEQEPCLPSCSAG